MGEKIRSKPELYPREEFPPGIILGPSNLLTLLLASKGNNPRWKPGQEIQISGLEERSLPPGWPALIEKEFKVARKGKGKGNIILSPLSTPDEEFHQLIELSSLAGLKPLIELITINPFAIDSLNLLPNTSLGVRNPYGFYPRKINGISVNFNNRAEKQKVQELLNFLRFPWGKSVSVAALRGIDVEKFISEFIDGSNLASSLPPPTKFLDFLYDDEKGEVYVVIGGGGLEKGTSLNISGTNKEVGGRLNTIYTNARKGLLEELEVLTRIIGGGVGFEEVTAYPYVGYDPDNLKAFSGLPIGGISDNVLFNPHPKSDLPYFLHTGSLIGLNRKSPVAQILPPLEISGKPLSRVADFGLK